MLAKIREGRSAVKKEYVDTGKLPEDIFNMFDRGDPTPNKKYLDWMAKVYISNPKRPEHMVDVIRAFHQMVMRSQIERKDIYQYKTVEEVDQTISQSEEQAKAKSAQKLIKKDKDVNVIRDDARFLIVVPETHEGAKPWGQEDEFSAKAEWCITGADTHWSRYYRAGDKFYFILDKKNHKKWCIQVNPSGKITAWDQNDRSMSYEEFERKLGLGEKGLAGESRVAGDTNMPGTYSVDELVNRLRDVTVGEDKITPIQQPALKGEEKADKDDKDLAADQSVEPVDFKKKSPKGEQDTMTKVKDTDLKKPTQLLDRAVLYLCNDCAKTFRSKSGVCEQCKKHNTERIQLSDSKVNDTIVSSLLHEDFEEQLKKGIKVEMEHTDDPEMAKKIAMDHLKEDSTYYDKLAKMEAGKCDEAEVKERAFQDLPDEELEKVKSQISELGSKGLSVDALRKEVEDELSRRKQKRESKVEEQEEENLEVVAKSVKDKQTADNIARGAGSAAKVVSDPDDEKKYMVVLAKK